MRYLILITVTAFLFPCCSKDKSPSSSINLQAGLRIYLPFNGNLEDSTGKVSSIIYTVSGTSFSTDRHDKLASALKLDEGKVIISSLNWTANPISISVWVKRADDTQANYMLAANDAIFGMRQVNKKVGFTISLPLTNSAYGETSDNWAHVAGTYDATTISVYVDGELAATQKHAGNPANVSELVIGELNSIKWKGEIDDLRVYDRLLSQEEIKALAAL